MLKTSRRKSFWLIALAAAAFVPASYGGRLRAAEATHGVRPDRLLITGAMMVDGVGTPAEGPVDILIEDGRIARVQSSPRNRNAADTGTAVIDAAGKYVLPGFINMHAHLHDSRAGRALPFQYLYNLWLGAGITTIRDVGSNADLAVEERKKSERGEIAAPRLVLYMWFPGGRTGEGPPPGAPFGEKEIRKAVKALKKRGADGIKAHQLDSFTYRILGDEAAEQGLKLAHHVGVKDATALDDIAAGTSTIEHWYGIPDAAVGGGQSFPADFNHGNELHRFRYAGRLWREADPEKLAGVLGGMVEAGVAWDPTFCIYEACRDLSRATTFPWNRDYLHPALEAFFEPNPTYHGSFFYGWTNTDEVYWRENYRIWMKAVLDFARMGGVVTTGEDAGFIYQTYGFGYLRELQLHEEAGFSPIEVIQHATHNGAKVLGRERELGRIVPGFLADLVVVNGNPIENLQILMPRGINPTLDAQREGGGVEWTIKDGIPYHAPTLLEDARRIVSEARAESVDE